MCCFCLKGPGELEGKAKQVGGVSSALKPEENLAAETSPFMLPSLHSTSAFLKCVCLIVFLFCFLHNDENMGLGLHYLFFYVIPIIDFWSTTAFIE